jgi:hypothetical protein
VIAGALFLAAAVHAGDPAQSYTIPKEHPALEPAQAQPPAGATPGFAINAAPVRWTLPAGWKEKPASGVRLASFEVPGQSGANADVSITSFPGSVGSELDNVNRWRSQLGLAPVAQGAVASEAASVDGLTGKVYDIAGASSRMIVADIPRNGNSSFVKMTGDPATIAAAKPAFLQLLASLHFGTDNAQTAAPAAMPPAFNPHATMGAARSPHGGGAMPETAPADAPVWTVPAKWVEGAPRAMVFKTYAIAGEGAGKAEVTVSFFSGSVGGVLANVNRWRGQIGLPPVDESQLAAITESLTVQNSKATLVDLKGPEANGQRMIAAIVPHGDNTWFYKLTGDAGVVAGQRETFVQFVKSAHNP